MRTVTAIILVIATVSVRAQTVANTSNVLHPILKDPTNPNNRYAPTSLNRDPSLAAEYRKPTPTAQPAAAAATHAVKPVEIVAQIDANLVASPISLIGTISGIKGRLYVTNVGTQTVFPKAQFAVCDRNGSKIASTAKTGTPLGPNEGERIDIVATNPDAVDLKLMKLSAATGP